VRLIFIAVMLFLVVGLLGKIVEHLETIIKIMEMKM